MSNMDVNWIQVANVGKKEIALTFVDKEERMEEFIVSRKVADELFDTLRKVLKK